MAYKKEWPDLLDFPVPFLEILLSSAQYLAETVSLPAYQCISHALLELQSAIRDELALTDADRNAFEIDLSDRGIECLCMETRLLGCCVDERGLRDCF